MSSWEFFLSLFFADENVMTALLVNTRVSVLCFSLFLFLHKFLFYMSIHLLGLCLPPIWYFPRRNPQLRFCKRKYWKLWHSNPKKNVKLLSKMINNAKCLHTFSLSESNMGLWRNCVVKSSSASRPRVEKPVSSRSCSQNFRLHWDENLNQSVIQAQD